jgi:hypothetical protein
MAFSDIAITIRAVNRASSEFGRIQRDAENMGEKIRSAGSRIAGLGALTAVIGHVAESFGLVDQSTARWISTLGTVTTALGVFLRTKWGVIVAEKAYSVATAIATGATWAFNTALAMKVALLTLGVGLVVATAAYMAWLASTTRDAAAAQQEYNATLATRERAARRRREEEDYERITRRGGYY